MRDEAKSDMFDPQLQNFAELRQYVKEQRFPLRRRRYGQIEYLAANHSVSSHQRKFPLRPLVVVTEAEFSQTLLRRFNPEMTETARSKLRLTRPKDSAHRLLDVSQSVGLLLILLVVSLAFYHAPLMTLVAANAVATFYYIAIIAFRFRLAALALNTDEKPSFSAPALEDHGLPIVTVLVPLFDEADCLPTLTLALEKIDYPPKKLDIKLIFEESDAPTRAAAEALNLSDRFELIVTPSSQPQTKPKACNFALPLSRGALVVVYDAEDEPEPDQIRKAAAAFASAPPDVACFQARLNFYNADENWLTRLFALEYALWFDNLLPALQKVAAPIPLGGTSNFLRTQTLLELGGWDAYNVTEDADLGMRLARAGYRTELLDSTTFEEANCSTGNWLRQRSRWMKGYMQTWAVHLRASRHAKTQTLTKSLSAKASVHLFLAGNFFGALINPLLWAIFIWWLATGTKAVEALFPGPLLGLNLFALIAGNFLFIYLAMIAPLRRGWTHLAPAALLAPVYWWLTSVAAYRALFQLVFRPFFWEKTRHGISAIAKLKRAQAMGSQHH